MGVIPAAIPEQSFERLRTRIFEIIADELYQQAAIAYDDDLSVNTYVERFIPISHTEMPAVNISYDNTKYGTNTTDAAQGLHSFSIDVYTSAKSTDQNRGDQLARTKLHKLLGVIRAILMDTRYVTLGFTKPSIAGRNVDEIKIADPISLDGVVTAMGRLVLSVREIDSVSLLSARVMDGYQTQVLIGVSDQGYVFSGSGSANPGAVCSPVSFLINSVSLADIDSGGTFNVTVVDSNGDSQGVASELTSYGVKITVPAAGTTSIDISLNSVLAYNNRSTDVDIAVVGSNNAPKGSWNIFSQKQVIVDSVVSNSDDTYSESVISETDLELPDTNVYVVVNGVAQPVQSFPTLTPNQNITVNVAWT